LEGVCGDGLMLCIKWEVLLGGVVPLPTLASKRCDARLWLPEVVWRRTHAGQHLKMLVLVLKYFRKQSTYSGKAGKNENKKHKEAWQQ